MDAFTALLLQTLEKVWLTFSHNWPYLLASILIATALRLYVNSDKVSAFITRYRRAGVLGATLAAVATPLCSCGTTAVILGMIASTVPWAPVVAFMVASPLTSPQELIYSAGLFGWPFALAFFIASILLGLLGGLLGEFFEARGWLAGQARFSQKPASVSKPAPVDEAPACACAPVSQTARQSFAARDIRVNRPVLALENAPAATSACACESAGIAAPARPETEQFAATATARVTARQWLDTIRQIGRQLLLMFAGFAFIGYFLNGLVPSEWVAAVFGAGNVYSIPLAATLGIPFYLNSEGSLPLVRALIDGGMSQGAALAFLITGSGTSIGAIAGALTIARWRVIGLVVGTLWVGAIALGYAYQFLLALGLW